MWVILLAFIPNPSITYFLVIDLNVWELEAENKTHSWRHTIVLINQ